MKSLQILLEYFEMTLALLRRPELGFPLSQEHTTLSVMLQLIQAVLLFVPSEWQLSDCFTCSRNDAQPQLQNLPAEQQQKDRGIAFAALHG